MDENCKDCPYVEALDNRLRNVEVKITDIDHKVVTATIENEKTKVYYEKVLDQINSLRDIVVSKFTAIETLFTEKYVNLENRVKNIEKCIDEVKKVDTDIKLIDRKETWGVLALSIGIILPYVLNIIVKLIP